MITNNGSDRGSFLWGSSTNNQRIERLWVDVGAQILRLWRAFFTRLEGMHCLQVESPKHLWLLHELFLEEINNDCDQFQSEWNHHSVSGPKTQDQTPSDMRLLSQIASGGFLEQGQDHLDLDLLQRFYGADGDISHGQPSTSGAGTADNEELYQPNLGQLEDVDGNPEDFSHLSEAELTTLSFIQEQLAAQQKDHVRHPPVKVPRHCNPFPTIDVEDQFWSAMQEACDDEYVPQGYGVSPGEWEEGIYPEIETIRIGNRKRGEMDVALPNSVWFPRAMSSFTMSPSSPVVAGAVASVTLINPSHRNYAHPDDKVFWVSLGNEIFPVHQHLLARMSPVFQGMIGPGPVSRHASTNEVPVPEGSSHLCPLDLEPHGTPEEWNMLFQHMYVAHYDTVPRELTRLENISLLSIGSKYQVPGAVFKAKAALETLGMPPPLQLSLGRRFRFKDWVDCAASLIVQLSPSSLTPEDAELIGHKSASMIHDLHYRLFQHRANTSVKLPTLLVSHAVGCRDQAKCLTLWKDICLLLNRHLIRPGTAISDTALLAVVETDKVVEQLMDGMFHGCVRQVKDRC
ncbi:hypothetical protein FS749_011321, partial [Ceratobasidium sp. UAMH 11750]